MIDITKVPFNILLGITVASDKQYLLQLEDKKQYTNHLDTVHAAALFALAEGSGAQLLLNIFPQNIIESVNLVLRKVDVAYKKPCQGLVQSKAYLKDGTTQEITETLINKKRVSILTVVELYDSHNVKVFTAAFEWFVALKS